MRQFFFILCLTNLFWFICTNDAYAQDSELSLGIGYLQKNLDWSIAGNLNGENPNIYSELQWNNIVGPYFRITGYQKISNHLRLIIHGNFSKTVSGTAIDNDYEENDRTFQIFSAEIKCHEGYGCYVSPAIGYQIHLSKENCITPSVGYSFSMQKFYLCDTAISENDQTLNSYYVPIWQGPSFSCQIKARLQKKLSGKIDICYEQLNYKSFADWNLISQYSHPNSFTHRAKGFSSQFEINFSYDMTQIVSCGLFCQTSYMSTGKGIDELFYADGTSAKTRLNDVTYTQLNFGIELIIKSNKPWHIKHPESY